MFPEAKRKAALANRIGTVPEGRHDVAPSKGERLSYRASLLINLAASAALYGLGYLAIKAFIHLIAVL